LRPDDKRKDFRNNSNISRTFLPKKEGQVLRKIQEEKEKSLQKLPK
jgi:hypothetical protein|tara:strand:- start:47 stop:184 length:138 start_codon:yes stop_codon:yes gene_type:complete